jgi:predicted HTH domain antitoxin
MEIKLKGEYDKWLRKIAKEVRVSPEELAYMSIEKFIKEYRTRKAIKAYVEGEISLGKAAEVAGMSKRKFMVMIEDFGIPLNLDARDFIKSFSFLSELRGYRAYKDVGVI